MGEFFKSRYNIISLAFMVIVSVIVCQLVNLQVINGEKYSELAQRKFLRETKLEAPRGSITDRNGVVIATNRQGFTVEIVNAGLKSSELNAMLFELIKVLEKNGDSYIKNLPISSDLCKFTGYLENNESRQKSWKKRLKIEEPDADARRCFEILRGSGRFDIGEEYSEADAWKIMNIRYELSERGFLSYAPLVISRDISKESVSEIEERNVDFPGISTGVVPVRRYVDASAAAHIVGYVRGLSPEELEEYQAKGYEMDDVIGKAGIEKVMESELRGKDGLRRTEVDSRGRFSGEIETIPDIPGNNISLTVDHKLQKVATESLERNIKKIRETPDSANYGDAQSGAAVVIDVNTGEILAMVSYPTYDPELFLADVSDPEVSKAIYDINTDKNSTLMNKAAMGIYAPGSTFKMLTAIAALEEGVITPEETVYDQGVFNYYNLGARCWIWSSSRGSHGHVNISKGIRVSCNYFFYEMGRRLGIDNIYKWGELFGLGRKTGIELPESEGILAGPEYRKKTGRQWYPGDTIHAAIGQGDNAFTPLQLAQYVAAIANGGKRYKPFIVKRIEKNDGTIVREGTPQLVEDTEIKPETLKAVFEGMLGVTTEIGGTATGAFWDFPIKVAGKTGTAQSPVKNASDNALFVGFAPYDNPEIAVAVVVHNGVHGSNIAPIARDIFAEYFGLNGDPTAKREALLPDTVRLIQ